MSTRLPGLADVRARVARVCERAGRDPDDVLLVIVTKTHPPETAQQVVDAGVADLGESRVQEFTAKAPRVEGARWHYVGRLQRNKAADVVGLADLIHSVDRIALADRIAGHASVAGIVQRVLVQVNVGEDPRKGGAMPDGVAELIARAIDHDSLSVEGLMTIPPMPPDDVDPADHARPYFARMRELRDSVQDRWPEVSALSMGMSADFEPAIEEGATMVRVGTAALGPRRDPPWEPVLPTRTERSR